MNSNSITDAIKFYPQLVIRTGYQDFGDENVPKHRRDIKTDGAPSSGWQPVMRKHESRLQRG